jgi:hypothetical protein
LRKCFLLPYLCHIKRNKAGDKKEKEMSTFAKASDKTKAEIAASMVIMGAIERAR